ncbi:MAG TPA: PQQ-binding-like beta-propeller repeat protein, partial [Acidimicrobiales bacterium]|nr:PQQ-binding-like beta-propeller repeat protein [Acidimicrobiales bacterium]
MRRRALPAIVAALAVAACSSSTTSQPPPTTASTTTASTTTASTTTASTTTITTATGSPQQPALWPTYHRDLARSGAEPSSPPASGVRRQWTSARLDGAINAEPLVVGTTVITATENNTVYALDAASGVIKWSTHLGSPMAGSDLPCGDIDPSGITSTPVIDAGAGLVFAVAFVKPGTHQLVELALTTGAVRSRRPVDPPGANPLEEQQRGALALAGGQVYVPYGGLFGDCGGFHGYLVSLPESGPGQLGSWQVPTTKGGGLWSPPGPVIDSGGQVLVATGNTESATAFDDGNAVVRLSPALRQTDVFAPTNWAELNAGDTDLGSVSPTLLPGGVVFQIGKEGIGYLLDASHLGGVGGQRSSAAVCRAAFGGTATSGSVVFVPCRDGLVALQTSGDRLSTAWRGPSVAAGSPVVAGGWVWFVDLSGELYGL